MSAFEIVSIVIAVLTLQSAVLGIIIKLIIELINAKK